MHEFFFEHFNKKMQFNDEEQAIIKDFFIPKKLRKKQYLLQQGDICKNIAFVNKGLLKSYNVGKNGAEHIVQFALEGWLISDPYSFYSGNETNLNIDAVEDSELLLISKAGQEELVKRIPKYAELVSMQYTNAYLAMQKRLICILSDPLEEQYSNLIQLYPDIIQRVPQRMIASYMGLKPETLSRVKKRMYQGK